MISLDGHLRKVWSHRSPAILQYSTNLYSFLVPVRCKYRTPQRRSFASSGLKA